MTSAVFHDLTPSRILDALDAVGLRPDGRILQLNSYENRVHQVFVEDGSAVVTKFYRPGRWSDAQILEEHAFALELAASEVPVVAPLELGNAGGHSAELSLLGDPATLAHWRQGHALHRFAVAPRSAGREPELERHTTLERLGQFIARLHLVGQRRPFDHRLTLDGPGTAERAFEYLLHHAVVPDEQRPAWASACRRCLDLIAEAFERHGPECRIRLHGDCHLGNVLWRDTGPHIVDLDDACNGPAVQDLWMLVSGDGPTMAEQLEALLRGYEMFRPFDRRELALIEALRCVRMLHHSAWLAQRWHDPAFPAGFPYFGTAAYWSAQTGQLREQASAMVDQPPASAR